MLDNFKITGFLDTYKTLTLNERINTKHDEVRSDINNFYLYSTRTRGLKALYKLPKIDRIK